MLVLVRNPCPRIYRLSKRIIFWQFNSRPYLSGDAFSDYCDYVAYRPKFRFRSWPRTNLEKASSIFCPGDKFEEFLKLNFERISAKILIIGNSDQDFDSFDYDLPASVKFCLVQNLYVENSKAGILPIGIENFRLGRNGLPYLFKGQKNFNKKSDMVLVGPFSPTHAERSEISQINYSKSNFRVISGRLSPRKYASFASEFKYILCPRGNGLDTHRFWETLYRGSIPIVKQSSWSETISKLRVPVIQVSDWNEHTILEAINESAPRVNNTFEISSLWWTYWKSKLENIKIS